MQHHTLSLSVGVAMLFLANCVCLSVSQGNEPPVAQDGFRPLFNGEDLSGWCGRAQVDPTKHRAREESERANQQKDTDESFREHWQVEDGEIINDGHGVFCTTEREFGDFELLVDWKMTSPDTDSGIYLRGCPQVQIWDPNHKPQHKHGSHL